MVSKVFFCFMAVFLSISVITGTAMAEPLKIALVTDVSGIDDQAFNQSAWEGLMRAEKELGVTIAYKESTRDADYGPNIETLTAQGYDLIWGLGFATRNAVLAAAQKHPDQKYGIVDFSYGPDTPANVCCVIFQEEQPSFLVGYIAGKMTRTNKVGFVGGIQMPVIEKFEYGYIAGVALANPGCDILSRYADSFTDATRGKTIAHQLYDQGADIVFHASGSVGDGVIEAAREKNRWVIGVDRDQSVMAPDHVLTSAMKRVDNAVFDMVKKLVAGEFKGGQTVLYNISNDGSGIAPTSGRHVPRSVLDETDDLIRRIASGELVVPTTREAYEAFIK